MRTEAEQPSLASLVGTNYPVIDMLAALNAYPSDNDFVLSQFDDSVRAKTTVSIVQFLFQKFTTKRTKHCKLKY
jgi:hypothetical protein